jgi:hypothetical protein
MSAALRTLLPPGGFSNLVGHAVAALDAGLESLREAARAVPEDALERAASPHVPSAAAALRAAGEREAQWVHGALGRVPTPPAPRSGSGREALLGWLDAVRTVSVMVLRPLADRDLERLVELPGVPGRTSVRRLLSDLLEHQAERRAEVRLARARG